MAQKWVVELTYRLLEEGKSSKEINDYIKKKKGEFDNGYRRKSIEQKSSDIRG